MAGMEDYVEAGDGATNGRTMPATSAGNNPSTWSGVMVIGAVLVLMATRRSFRRFM